MTGLSATRMSRVQAGSGISRAGTSSTIASSTILARDDRTAFPALRNAGCASRICFQLVQVVYALNATWPPPDRVALNRAAALLIRPADFATRVQRLLAHMGATPEEQSDTAAQLRELWTETVRLGGSLYTPRMSPT